MSISIRNNLVSAIVCAASFAIPVLLAVPALAQGQPPANGWFKVCSKQEDNEICNVQFQAVASNGQVVTAVSLAEVKGKINRKVFQVTVPTGRLIQPGIKIKVDDKKEFALPFAFCFPQNCMAEVAMDDNLIALLKGGKAMIITSTNFQNKANPVEVTLNGFTGVFDGPPLKRDELEARQRQLQDELRKKAEEQRKKLQEEQDKAKAGTAAN